MKVNNIDSAHLEVLGTTPASSFDPLDADISSNMYVMRMLYATPIEIGQGDTLTSNILSNFWFEPENNQMIWEVKEDLKYEDGTKITSKDVTLAVTRMLIKRPDFPTLTAITGVTTWLSSKSPLTTLPSGIVLEDNRITIKFSKPVFRPLFRFSLEVFSIIPSSCINHENGALTCAMPPESGPYKLVSKVESSFNFERRATSSKDKAKKITIEFIRGRILDEQLKSLDESRAILTSDMALSNTELNNLISEYNVHQLPKTRFIFVAINPEVKPFTDSKCRLYFSNAIRNSYHKITKRNLDSSLFPTSLPGYLNTEKLQEVYNQDLTNHSTCLSEFQKDSIPHKLISSGEKMGLSDQMILDAAKSLGLSDTSFFRDETKSDRSEAFVSGKAAFYTGTLGFWPADPLGDLQMMFTPNMHVAAQPIATNPKFRSLLTELAIEGPQINLFEKFNEEIFKDATFNVIAPYGRLIIRQKSDQESLLTQGSMKALYPWQMFL